MSANFLARVTSLFFTLHFCFGWRETRRTFFVDETDHLTIVTIILFSWRDFFDVGHFGEVTVFLS